MNNRIHVHQILARIMVRALKTKINIPAIVLLVGQEVNVKQKLVVILELVMVTENVVFPKIIQFVIVMQDGKGHNVIKPIPVPYNRVKTKEDVYKRDLLTDVNAGSVGVVKHVTQKLYVTQQLVMDMVIAVFTVII